MRQQEWFQITYANYPTAQQECFQDKDYTNYRYFAKRACYIAQIARALQSNPMFANMKYEAFQGDSNRPVLVITPKGVLSFLVQT